MEGCVVLDEVRWGGERLVDWVKTDFNLSEQVQK